MYVLFVVCVLNCVFHVSVCPLCWVCCVCLCFANLSCHLPSWAQFVRRVGFYNLLQFARVLGVSRSQLRCVCAGLDAHTRRARDSARATRHRVCSSSTCRSTSKPHPLFSVCYLLHSAFNNRVGTHIHTQASIALVGARKHPHTYTSTTEE